MQGQTSALERSDESDETKKSIKVEKYWLNMATSTVQDKKKKKKGPSHQMMVSCSTQLLRSLVVSEVS